jgi:hypothetical protein
MESMARNFENLGEIKNRANSRRVPYEIVHSRDNVELFRVWALTFSVMSVQNLCFSIPFGD